MNHFCVLNRLKAIKKASSGLLWKFAKIEISLRALIFRKLTSFFFVLLSHLETNHFSYQGSVNYKPHLQSIEAQ